jgi:hypothetical protein
MNLIIFPKYAKHPCAKCRFPMFPTHMHVHLFFFLLLLTEEHMIYVFWLNIFVWELYRSSSKTLNYITERVSNVSLAPADKGPQRTTQPHARTDLRLIKMAEKPSTTTHLWQHVLMKLVQARNAAPLNFSQNLHDPLTRFFLVHWMTQTHTGMPSPSSHESPDSL